MLFNREFDKYHLIYSLKNVWWEQNIRVTAKILQRMFIVTYSVVYLRLSAWRSPYFVSLCSGAVGNPNCHEAHLFFPSYQSSIQKLTIPRVHLYIIIRYCPTTNACWRSLFFWCIFLFQSMHTFLDAPTWALFKSLAQMSCSPSRASVIIHPGWGFVTLVSSADFRFCAVNYIQNV